MIKLFNRWPINVFIIQKRTGGGKIVKKTRAQRRTGKDGTVRYILKNGKTIPPVLYEKMTDDNHLFVYQDKTENYAAMDIQEPGERTDNDENIGKKTVNTENMKNPLHPVVFEPAKITGIDVNVKNWAINSLKKDREKWMEEGFWKKYGHFIAPAVLLIAASLMIYISLEKLIALDQISANAINRLTELLKNKAASGAAGW